MNLIQNILEDLYLTIKSRENNGVLANYIPELSKVDPKNFGIVLTTIDGHQYKFGDTDIPFTIQSISKPFVYGMALQEHGVAKVLDKISVEPSGDAFNSISLYPDSGRPFNPMINAGAIASTSLIFDVYRQETFDKILSTFSNYTGSKLDFDKSVYESERCTGHRNIAIAYLLRNFNIIEDDVDAPVDAYFKQCSINVTCSQLSVMGATLANNGINPKSGKRVIDLKYVPKVLSVMSTCGMYDYSGEWIYNVGLPAKSGVGGGVLAVLPGQLSIAVYSPPLDVKGNSVFGVEICKQIGDRFSLHLYKTPRISQAVVRKHLTLKTMRSKLKRTEEADRILQMYGGNTHIIELQGELNFASCEIFIRYIPSKVEILILDLRKCSTIDDAALVLLQSLNKNFEENGKKIYLTNHHHLEFLNSNIEPRPYYLKFDDREDVLIFCEEGILAENNYQTLKEPIPLANQQLLSGLTDSELKKLEKFLEYKEYVEDELILKNGKTGDSIFFLASGKVAVIGANSDNQEFKMAIFSAGNSFGEMALLENKTRSADVRAESKAACFVMKFEKLDLPALSAIKMKILKNLAASLSERLRLANQEIAGFM